MVHLSLFVSISMDDSDGYTSDDEVVAVDRVPRTPQHVDVMDPVPTTPPFTMFSCADCFMNFASQRELDDHLGECTAYRPDVRRQREITNGHKFVCSLCTQKFNRRENLKDHMAQLHGIGTKVWRCTRCPLEFKKKGGLARHTAEMHGVAARVFTCKQCGHSCKRAYRLRQHKCKPCISVADILDRRIESV